MLDKREETKIGVFSGSLCDGPSCWVGGWENEFVVLTPWLYPEK
jgi:hypothetical protein